MFTPSEELVKLFKKSKINLDIFNLAEGCVAIDGNLFKTLIEDKDMNERVFFLSISPEDSDCRICFEGLFKDDIMHSSIKMSKNLLLAIYTLMKEVDEWHMKKNIKFVLESLAKSFSEEVK